MYSEEQLIKQCKRSNLNAQKVLYEKYALVLKGICLRYTGNLSEAENVLHDGFIKIFSCIGQYKNTGSFEGWLKRIMINTALSYLKKELRNGQSYNIDDVDETKIGLENDDESESKDIQSIIYKAEFSQSEILKVVNCLPVGFRTVFNLYALENYSHKQIAEMLGISINTSKSQLSRARKVIQKELLNIAKHQKSLK